MKQYKNILLSCTFAIGDVVMATAAAALLKKIYPGVKITMIVKKLAEELAYENPVIDEVLSLAYEQKKASLAYMQEMRRFLAAQKYDLFISLDGKVRPALLAVLAGIPVRIGPSSMFGSNTRMPFVLTRVIDVPDFKATHYTEVLLGMIRAFAHSELTAKPVVPAVRDSDKIRVQKLIADLPDNGPLIGLCVRTNPRKTWPADKFVDVMQRLHNERNAKFYIIGGGYDKEYVEQMLQGTALPVVNLCGVTTLREVQALLFASDLFITLDTAPMHIASAMDIPQVAIFGSTAVASVAPLSPKAVIIAPDLPCIPCIPLRVSVLPGIQRRTGPKECPEHTCMQLITVDAVLHAALAQLEKYSQKA